jgi:ABC-type branched-subunit amino acid transport system substrate-binding protein
MVKFLATILLAVVATSATAQSGDQILIGQSAPATGDGAELAKGVTAGIKAYFDFVNANGGVGGRKLQLQSMDDGGDAARATANTKALIDNANVLALIGYVGGATSQAGANLADQSRIPLVGPVSGAPGLRNFSRYVFNIRGSNQEEGERIVQQLTTVGSKKISVVFENNLSGRAAIDGISKGLEKRKLQLAGLSTIDPFGKEAARSISTAMNSQPDAVVIAANNTAVINFIKAARQSGYKGQIAAMSLLSARALAQGLGKDGVGVMVSQLVPLPGSGGKALTREYTSALTAAGQTDFDFASFEGWIAARVLVDGIKRAGRNLSREAIASGLEGLGTTDLGGYTVSFRNGDHNGSHFVELVIIGANGEFRK